MEGPESVRAIIEQLEGFEAPAASWEGELLPSRLAEYDPAWLDALCLSGEVVWARLTPPASTAASRLASSENGVERVRGAAPVRNTPIALLQRKNFAIWNSVFPQPSLNEAEFSTTTSAVHDYLATRGASFFTDIVEGTKLLRSQVEEALAELVANGLVISDSFAGLRALLTPSSSKTQAALRRKHRQPVYEMSSAGRWSLLKRDPGTAAGTAGGSPATWGRPTAERLCRRSHVIRSRRRDRPHPAQTLRRRLQAFARARRHHPALASAASHLSPPGSARRDSRRPLCGRDFRRTVCAARSCRNVARNPPRPHGHNGFWFPLTFSNRRRVRRGVIARSWTSLNLLNLNRQPGFRQRR